MKIEVAGPTCISGTIVVLVMLALNEPPLYSAGCVPPIERVDGLEGWDEICGSC